MAQVRVVLYVDTQSTIMAGIAGDTELSFTGRGFHDQLDPLTITLFNGAVPCHGTASGFTTVACVTEAPPASLFGQTGAVGVAVNGIAALCDPAVCVCVSLLSSRP